MPAIYLHCCKLTSLTTHIGIGAKGNRIELFSLKTGERISSPLEKYRYQTPVDCLVFEECGVENRFGPQTPSLLVGAKGGVVDQWIW